MTPAEQRAAAFGKIGAAFGAGFMLGPAIGGLLGGIDPRLPFWVAAGLGFANALYGLLILPESLPRDRRSPFRWKRANPVGALRLLRSDRVLAGLSVVNFLAQVAHVVLPSTFVLYATYRYRWDARDGRADVGAGRRLRDDRAGPRLGPIVRQLGERQALVLGLGSGADGFLIYGVAPTGPLFWLGMPVMSLWGVAGASAQASRPNSSTPSSRASCRARRRACRACRRVVGPFLVPH